MHGVPDSDDIVEMKLYIAGSCVLMAVVLLMLCEGWPPQMHIWFDMQQTCHGGGVEDCVGHPACRAFGHLLTCAYTEKRQSTSAAPVTGGNQWSQHSRWTSYHCILGKAKDARKTLLGEIGPLMLPNFILHGPTANPANNGSAHFGLQPEKS